MQLNDFVYWIDANLPPRLATWLMEHFQVEAYHISELFELNATDAEIFKKAKASNNVVIITKDEDFADMVLREKYPPYIVWITLGNISNAELNKTIIDFFEEAVIKLIESDFGVIEMK